MAELLQAWHLQSSLDAVTRADPRSIRVTSAREVSSTEHSGTRNGTPPFIGAMHQMPKGDNNRKLSDADRALLIGMYHSKANTSAIFLS